jgi:hypothetical protein
MSEGKIFYRCIPEKNKECRKRACYRRGGPCRATSRTDCAVRDADGNPIEEFRVRDKENGTD